MSRWVNDIIKAYVVSLYKTEDRVSNLWCKLIDFSKAIGVRCVPAD